MNFHNNFHFVINNFLDLCILLIFLLLIFADRNDAWAMHSAHTQ